MSYYTEPNGTPIELRVPPRLASWMASGHRDQLRLSAALAHAHKQLEPYLGSLSGAVALRLDVGLPEPVDVLMEHDLDNYAYPLARHLTKTTGVDLVSVWCTKARGNESFVRIEVAKLVESVAPLDFSAEIETTASGTSKVYKQEIYGQLAGARELRDGAVELQIAFTVGPRRNWLNLWKPTIDALGLLLGQSRPEREWHPRDGRITRLGLHRGVDATLGNRVRISIAASSSGAPAPAA